VVVWPAAWRFRISTTVKALANRNGYLDRLMPVCLCLRITLPAPGEPVAIQRKRPAHHEEPADLVRATFVGCHLAHRPGRGSGGEHIRQRALCEQEETRIAIHLGHGGAIIRKPPDARGQEMRACLEGKRVGFKVPMPKVASHRAASDGLPVQVEHIPLVG